MDLYDWEIKYRPGRSNGNADAMSRMSDLSNSGDNETESLEDDPERWDPTPAINTLFRNDGPQSHGHVNVEAKEVYTLDENDVKDSPPEPNNKLSRNYYFTQSLSIDQDEIRKCQQSDVNLRQVIQWLQDGEKPPKSGLAGSDRSLRKLWWEYPKLRYIDGILYRELLLPGRSCMQTVIPGEMVPKTLELLHGSGYAGHLSFEKTFKKAHQRCYWPYMQKDIRIYCETCNSCNTRRQPTPRHKAPLQNITVSRPFQVVCADITELPITPKGNRYVLVVMDHFSKYVNLYPMPDQKAITVSTCLFEQYIRQHGIPEQIHTDQGRQFEGELVTSLCKALGIKKTRTTPYHPQSDGLIERFNRTLKDQLAKFLIESQGHWDDYIGQVEFAYNSSCHSTTGFSPYFILHGREPRIPASLMSTPPVPSNATPGTPAEYCSSLKERHRSAFQYVIDDSQGAQQRQKYYYDRKEKYAPYAIEDLVMLDNAAESRSKLAPKWLGPFKVVSHKSQPGEQVLTYEIQDECDPRKTRIVHHNRLKPFIQRPTQEQISSAELSSPQKNQVTQTPIQQQNNFTFPNQFPLCLTRESMKILMVKCPP